MAQTVELRRWRIKNSRIDSYLEDFRLVDKDGRIQPFLESLKEINNPVMLDFLSWTDALRSIARDYHIPRISGAAVAFSDTRGPLGQSLDNNLGIIQIAGDVNQANPWNEVENFLDGRKAHLILERGYGGLKVLNSKPAFYCATINKLWNMLDPENGMMLLQTLNFGLLEALGVPVYKWIEQMQERGIYCRSVPEYPAKKDGYYRYGLIMLIRDTK